MNRAFDKSTGMHYHLNEKEKKCGTRVIEIPPLYHLYKMVLLTPSTKHMHVASIAQQSRDANTP